jgi:hypothetical protein
MIAVRNIALGFVAGALAVLIFHQGMYYLMATSAMGVKGAPWRTDPVPFMRELFDLLGYPPFRIPRLASQMIWGGLWGALFGLIADRVSAGPTWLKGLLFGMAGPLLLGSWLILPLIQGEQIFGGYELVRMRTGFLLNGLAFGLGLGIIYGLLPRGRGQAQAWS